ncbi:MAG: hypothetical protein QXO51_06710 [Halobacteria archaeon]
MQAEVFDEVFRQMWRDYKALAKPATLMALTWVGFAFAYHMAAVNPFLQATGWPIRFGTADEERFRTAVTEVLRPNGLPLIAVQLCLYLFFHLVLIITCRQVRGGNPDFPKALKDAARSWPRYFATVLLLLAVFFLVAGSGYLLANALAPPPPGYVPSLFQPHVTPVHVAAMVAGVAAAVYIGLRWNLFPFAIALGEAKPLQSLSQSWKATRGQWWSMFMALVPLFILLLIIVAGVGLVVSLPFTLPSGLTPLLALPTGHYSPGEYPLALSWNQGATLALNTVLLVFLLDVPFVYGHTVVWEMTQEQFKPRPKPPPKPKRKAAPPPPPPRPPLRPRPEMGTWRLPPSEPSNPPPAPEKK